MNKTKLHANQNAFTIVELLVVFVIIGILVGLVFNVVANAQTRARNATADKTLQEVENAIVRLSIDTGKWPNGCPPNETNDPEADIEDDISGLTQTPPVGIIASPCQWDAGDVNAWQGPYLSDSNSILDPWGNSYVFDPDYYAYNSCASIADEPTQPAVVSYGPDGVRYTCDDVFRPL